MLRDQNKHDRKTHNCEMYEKCLNKISKDLLKKHKEQREGVKGKAKRIEMPEQEKNNVKFINHFKQMLSPFVACGNLKTLVKN